jgi:hypothetical protein
MIHIQNDFCGREKHTSYDSTGKSGWKIGKATGKRSKRLQKTCKSPQLRRSAGATEVVEVLTGGRP